MNNIKNRLNQFLKKQKPFAFPTLNRTAFVKHSRHTTIVSIIGILFFGIGYVAGLAGSFNSPNSGTYWNAQIAGYYDPVDVVRAQETITLIDIRPADEYASGHISHAINIPVVLENDSVANRADVLAAVSQIGKEADIVLYGENSYMKEPYLVAQLVASKGYSVKVLRTGWNEFSHFSSFWLPEDLQGTTDMMRFMEGSRFEN